MVGQPTQWADLIDEMVPQILNLVIASWQQMPAPDADEGEDRITVRLCRLLKQNRTARDLMFTIHTQSVELDPRNGQGVGRLDIAFFPSRVSREDIYFGLEAKRLNVAKDGKTRAYATEYVKFGMMRFVTGQYSKAVRHGGMIAYVLDGNVLRAIRNVEANIRRHGTALRMKPPGAFLPSAAIKNDRVRETHHRRVGESRLFRIHHLFMTHWDGSPHHAR